MTLDPTERASLIERYRAGHAALVAAVEGVADDELDAHPIEGEWSVREVVHHVADSEMTSAIRLRRLIAEEDPLIAGYDGDEFARRLHYANRPIEPALAAVDAARATTAQILHGLTDMEWSRTGTHSESGPYGVETWLEIYAVHCDDHARQIRGALAAD
jgi:DinB superfamily